MSRVKINESSLKAIINESIYEVLNEGEFNEGIGHWLGSMYQGARNKWNNFKNDFKAGQNYQRYKNMDYDSYEKYGDEGNNFRNLNGDRYGAYRYNKTVERNNNATPYGSERHRNNTQQVQPEVGQNNIQTQPQSNNVFTPNPDLGNNQQQSQQITPNKQMPSQNGRMKAERQSNEIEARRRLYRAGLTHQGDYNNPTGWKRTDGQPLNEPQKNLIRNWKKYKLQENKKKK